MTTPTCSGTCLKVASLVISAETSIPCNGGVGSVDIAAQSDLTACTTGITWTLVSWDTAAFTSVSLSSSGVLAFTSTIAAVAGTFYEFIGKVHCNSTLLSQYFKITVPIKNLCYGTAPCSTGFFCNTCTGGCVAEVDVELF